MKTWLNTIGEWHQKLSDWAYADGISAWKSALRIIAFVVLDTVLWMILFWGIMILVLMVFSKFASKTDEEIE